MQISARPEDRDYDPLAARIHVVFLDGKLVDRAFRANDEEGWVEVWGPPGDVDNTKLIMGKVELVLWYDI